MLFCREVYYRITIGAAIQLSALGNNLLWNYSCNLMRFIFPNWNYKHCPLNLLFPFQKYIFWIMYSTCNENPIYVFPEKELSGLNPNFHIHVFVSDLYIPRIGPHISCSWIVKLIVGIYKLLTDTWMWKLGLWPRNFFSKNICFEFSVLVLCGVHVE